jgi:putative flippase GtrA
MNRVSTIYAYTVIAVTASCCNLFLQYVFLQVYRASYAIELSIVAATAIVLPFKYMADKKFVFKFSAPNRAQDLLKFVTYTVVSIFTVAIFWGVEYAAHIFFNHPIARYIAGAVGLGLSFYAKYLLDKKYVF